MCAAPSASMSWENSFVFKSAHGLVNATLGSPQVPGKFLDTKVFDQSFSRRIDGHHINADTGLEFALGAVQCHVPTRKPLIFTVVRRKLQHFLNIVVLAVRQSDEGLIVAMELVAAKPDVKVGRPTCASAIPHDGFVLEGKCLCTGAEAKAKDKNEGKKSRLHEVILRIKLIVSYTSVGRLAQHRCWALSVQFFPFLTLQTEGDAA